MLLLAFSLLCSQLCLLVFWLFYYYFIMSRACASLETPYLPPFFLALIPQDVGNFLLEILAHFDMIASHHFYRLVSCM